MDQATLALLENGLRHIKGLVGILDRWVTMQKGNTSSDQGGHDKQKDVGSEKR